MRNKPYTEDEKGEKTQAQLLRLIKASPSGMTTAELIAATGKKMAIVSQTLNRMKKNHLVVGSGRQGVAAKWTPAQTKAIGENLPSEYLLASDVFQIGYRVARKMRRVREFSRSA